MLEKFTDFVCLTLERYSDLKIKKTNQDRRRLLFHAVCREILKEEYNEKRVNNDVPFGGIIGINNSAIDSIFKHSKIFRLHAAYHDAFGYCKTHYNRGPGYNYIVYIPLNSCLVGHVTGLYFWIHMYICRRPLIHLLDI